MYFKNGVLNHSFSFYMLKSFCIFRYGYNTYHDVSIGHNSATERGQNEQLLAANAGTTNEDV